VSVATYVDGDGAQAGTVSLPDEIFDVEPNVPVMHAVVRAHLAAIRAGTHSTKTRAEVRGGGRKPWRQKGTGRARHGSIREPQWVGGGIAHGPKPRDYAFSLTKKTRALALKGALSDRAREGSIVVVDLPAFEEPKTKRAVELLERWGASGKVLIVTGQRDPTEHIDTWKSFRNLPHVLMVQVPTTYRVLAADVVVLTREALAEITKSDVSVEGATPAPEPVLEAPETVAEVATESVPEIAPESVPASESGESEESTAVPEAGEAE
jgi:large subunit ribosomal protein L4